MAVMEDMVVTAAMKVMKIIMELQEVMVTTQEDITPSF